MRRCGQIRASVQCLDAEVCGGRPVHWDLLQCRSQYVPGRERCTCSTSEQQCSSWTGGNERGLCRLDSSAGYIRSLLSAAPPRGPASICELICCVDECDAQLGGLLNYSGGKLLLLWTTLARSKACNKQSDLVLA